MIPSTEHFDVIIIGAGLSGIGAGYRLQTRCPSKRYVILEGRAEIGGTWDLFRYPGVRSDSDMHTLGYPFRPWKEPEAIADGARILQYVRDTAQEFGIDRNIRFRQRVVSASWSSEKTRWTVETKSDTGETRRYACNFLYGCTGYYRYDAGYQPGFRGAERFRGRFVHPQQWPEDLDYADKRVVIIGSGATAVTMVPAMARTAAHVTMLQRSPSYILSLPNHDPIARLIRRLLPERAALHVVRWKNILINIVIFQISRLAPNHMRRMLRDGAIKDLPQGYEVDKHFNPSYQPWDQRLCLIPDSDFYKSISAGRASVVTDEIDTLTEHGICLKSGAELEADIVVSATGLRMLVVGGVRLIVDGMPVEPSRQFIYKGTMISNVPNFAFCIGYTNPPWTLRADLASTYLCRMLNHMDRRGYSTCMPACDPASLEPRPLLNLKSGYIRRAAADLPKSAATAPWLIRQNYIRDWLMMKLSRLEDGVLQFSKAVRVKHPDVHQEAQAVGD